MIDVLLFCTEIFSEFLIELGRIFEVYVRLWLGALFGLRKCVVLLDIFIDPRHHRLPCSTLLEGPRDFRLLTWLQVHKAWKALHPISTAQLVLLRAVNHQELDFILWLPIRARDVVLGLRLLDHLVPVRDELLAEVAPLHVELHDQVSVGQAARVFIRVALLPRHYQFPELLVARDLLALGSEPPFVAALAGGGRREGQYYD